MKPFRNHFPQQRCQRYQRISEHASTSKPEERLQLGRVRSSRRNLTGKGYAAIAEISPRHPSAKRMFITRWGGRVKPGSDIVRGLTS